MSDVNISMLAAEWWANKIQRPRFDNGDNSKESEIAGFLALLLASDSRKDLDDEKIENFKNVLSTKIQLELIERGICQLDVDYYPEGVLYDAAVEVSVSEDLFPWKTCMRVTNETIEVQEGYGKPYKEIYPFPSQKNINF